MKISKIYISCYYRDVNLTKICVASIRYWYPDIRILLVKDESLKKFSTKDIEKNWDVEVFNNDTIFVSGRFSILSLLIQKGDECCLYLDSDLVFCGPVLSVFEEYDTDVVVSPNWDKDPYHPLHTKRYYNYAKLKEVDPGFKFTGYTFNAGQIAFKEGVFSPEDFLDYLDVTPTNVTNKRGDIISLDDQGLLNYTLVKMESDRKISISKIEFMLIPYREREIDICVSDIINKKEKFPFILHWAGISGRKFIHYMTQSEILIFFNDLYYSRLKYGFFKKYLDLILVYYQPLKSFIRRRMKSI